MAISEPTAIFSIRDEKDEEIKKVVLQVYSALEEKGYNPINQLVGYILSEDPTYITTYKNARALIRRVDRDDLLQALVRDYVRQVTPSASPCPFCRNKTPVLSRRQHGGFLFVRPGAPPAGRCKFFLS